MTCDQPAVALLTFAPPEAKAWLYDLTDPDPTTGIMLCRKHANGTVVPMSWQLIDARDPAWPGPARPDAVAQIDETVRALDSVRVADATSLSVLPSDGAALGSQFDALGDLPITPRPYSAPREVAARAAHAPGASDLLVEIESSVGADPSLFELPLDIPAVTPHPGFG